jgi:hypothetical protein
MYETRYGTRYKTEPETDIVTVELEHVMFHNSFNKSPISSFRALSPEGKGWNTNRAAETQILEVNITRGTPGPEVGRSPMVPSGSG